ncbi:MAG: ATP-dependent DNA helicase RecG [Anaerolineae bacterium]|nr:ATP-dependent DNA helicase RecG [Anaerolineae bacterium]
MISSAWEKLTKVLKLEQSKGHRDDAVIGGLDKFVDLWQSEARAEAQAEADAAAEGWIGEIAASLANYAGKDEHGRAKVVDQVLGRLEQIGLSAQQVRVQPQAVRPDAPSEQAPSLVPPRPRPATGLDAPVESLPGISSGFSARLCKLGIATVADLLYHLPHRYDDYRTLKPISRLEYGQETTIIGTIWETKTRSTRSGGAIVSSIIADASGTIEAVWFNQPYLVRQLRAGMQIVLSGKVDEHLGRLMLRAPAWEPLERDLIHTGRLVPIYPLTEGITSRWLRRLMKRVLDYWAPRLTDHLPQTVLQRAGLMDLPTAIRQIHFPDSQETAEQARRRLSFDEFLMIQLGMLRQRQQWQSEPGIPLPRDQALLDAFLASLPFALTAAQQRSLEQILDDMAQNRPMSRLLQGDVGSGKTVVAAAAILMAIKAGKQVALMAPTEILAEQHHHSIAHLLDNAQDWGLQRPISVLLLTGSVGRKERQEAYTALASGKADVVIGTHALIQQDLSFHDLALVIVDEQHRFGVVQRATLRGKGASPHMLVMSATPIPRSLALTVYGDLDISVIDELPPGRQPIQTRWLLPRERERAYAFIHSQIAAGHQAFILYPLIEETEKVEARAATEEYERLQQTIFRTERLGLLHGKIKPGDKEEVMTRFRQGELDILVSTSVVEVGIDVPNATVMLVEGADRFGLAQLHQFRGRVGRSEHKSYCLLISDATSPDQPQTKATWERLKAIEETQDGFALAEKDLELRGPGDFLGIRQSGLPELRMASLSNVQVLEQARSEAQLLFASDPTLSQPEHQLLAGKVTQFWQSRGELS